LELQIETVGRMTGDIFIAALLDAFPDYEDAVLENIDAVSESYPVDCRLEYVRDNQFRGRRFVIEPYTRYFGHLYANPDGVHQTWSQLRYRLQTAALSAGVRRHAMALLTLLTGEMAAGRDHSLDAVTFSGNQVWQVVAQTVGAAALIDGLGGATWSAYALSREIPSPIARALLTHLGIPQRDQPQPFKASRTILRNGVGFAVAGSAQDGQVRVNCFDELGQTAMPLSAMSIPVAQDQEGSCS
jgi:uncharacterized protein (DUF111 family)